jgi:adenylate cyclase
LNIIRRHSLIVVVLAALVSSGLTALPQFDGLHGLSIDVLTWLRWITFGPLHDPSRSPAVVVALDEETYNSKPFHGTPTVTWTREIGRVVAALVDGGATVIGFDIIFPNTIEQSEIPFGNETVGARMRGFDRDFLISLASAARAGKLVLGQLQGQNRPIAPSDAQRLAVGYQRNIRPLNLYTDPDGIVRRVPLMVTVDGLPTPSMAVELAARVLGTGAEANPERTVMLKSYRAPEGAPNTLTLNFEGGADDIPTYSLVDLRECLDKGETAYFRRNFADRVVLIGVVLDQEDRSLTSKRFATGIEGGRGERCDGKHTASRGRFARDSIASVYIHATAVNNLLRQEPLRELSPPAAWGFGFGLAALASALALVWGPSLAALAVLSLLIMWLAIGTLALVHGLVLPVFNPSAAAILALFGTIAYRFAVTDKDKRLLRRSFAFYLAPAVIERVMASNKLPHLGGETRILTLYRSDLADFTPLSERLTPSELVAFMNDYLSAMTEIIERHGGFVDKYIGDAIDGVFGAPLDDADHALNAVKSALAGQAKLAAMNEAGVPTFKGHRPRQRIGLHTGSALVGNIGSQRRFNYTVVGDAANLASRLEGANKFYGTSIIASEATVTLAGPTVIWRELDIARVVGRIDPVKIFEPLAEAGMETTTQKACASAYAEGLKRWRSRDFAGAFRYFGEFADRDPPSSSFLQRAAILMRQPPGLEWSPITALDSK